MGCRYRFHCPDCGYKADISRGGDGGFVAGTTTIVCLDCRGLFDIVTGTILRRRARRHRRSVARKAAPDQGVAGMPSIWTGDGEQGNSVLVGLSGNGRQL
jgi:hypothetical protein